MIKAVFIDYTGTTVQEKGTEIQELVTRLCRNSSLHEPEDVVRRWWTLVKQYEESCFGERYLTEDEIVDRILEKFKIENDLNDSAEELHDLVRRFWVNAPLFPDAEEFFVKCPIPVYVISNNGIQYVEKAMKQKGLLTAGIIYADMVRAYKPRREIFDKALEVSGCRAEKVLHIGDSYSSDVQGAAAAGIRPVLIQRTEGQEYEDVTVIRRLTEALTLL